MASAARDARLRFLEASAVLYSSTAPATSAHLMLQSNAEAAAVPKTNRKNPSDRACGGCGTLSIHGQTPRNTVEKENVPRRFSSKSQPSKQRQNKIFSASRKIVKVECLVCHRYVKNSIEVPRGKAIGGREESAPASSTTSAGPDLGKSAFTAKSSSKQRAKARKQGGLHALLEKSRKAGGSSSGFGLDLLDLMKQN